MQTPAMLARRGRARQASMVVEQAMAPCARVAGVRPKSARVVDNDSSVCTEARSIRTAALTAVVILGRHCW
jgi:hypothetical protein